MIHLSVLHPWLWEEVELPQCPRLGCWDRESPLPCSCMYIHIHVPEQVTGCTLRDPTHSLCVCARTLILSTSSVSIKSKALPIYSHCLPAGNKPLSSKRSSLWIYSCFFTLFLPCWELSPLTSVHVQLPAGNWFFFSAPLSEVVKCGSSLWSVKISRWRQIRVCAELAGLCCTAARLLGIYTLYITTKCDEAEVALHTFIKPILELLAVVGFWFYFLCFW